MKKRIASLFLALVMIATLGSGAMAATTQQQLVSGNTSGLSAANFKDLADATKADGRHWAWDSIDHVVKAGLFNGTSATTFAPQNPMTRAQFVVVVTRLENTTRTARNKLNVERVPTQTRFTDVPEDMWCAGAVAWAEANGIVEGYSDNTFRPNQAISRAQIAAFVYRYANNYKRYTLKTVSPEPEQFTDFALASTVFHTAINYCRTHDLIRGYGDHTLRPNISVTRAQVAAILSRIILIIQSSRGGGGGGGGGGVVTAGFDKTAFNAANWADLVNYPYGVKYVAVDETGAAAPDWTAGADLDDGRGNTDTTLQSGEAALISRTKSAPLGFTLTAKPAPEANGLAYAVKNVYVYSVAVDDQATAPAANLLVRDTDYTVTTSGSNTVVKMDQTKFAVNAYQRVTVVVEFTQTKTQPTNIRFVAAKMDGANWAVAEPATGKASAKMFTTSDNAETTEMTSNTTTVTQKLVDGVWQSMEMAIIPNSGYEITDVDDIRVYDTTVGPWNNGGILLEGSAYDLVGNTVAMDNEQFGTMGEITVVALFTQSLYEYKMSVDLDVMSGVGLHVATTNSFNDGRWLSGGTPIKDAARLLVDDGPNSTDNQLGSDAGFGNNASKFSGTINSGLTVMIQDMLTKHHDADPETGESAYDGFKKDVTNMGRVRSLVEDMVSSGGADALAAKLTAADGQNLDNDILSKIDLNDKMTQVKNGMFNAVLEQKSAIAAANNIPSSVSFDIDPRGFVDQAGNVIPASRWANTINAANFAISMAEGNKLTASDITFNGVEKIALILTQVSEYEIQVKTELVGLSVTLNSLKGFYDMTVNMGDLYVIPIVNGAAQAPVRVNDQLASPADPVNGVTVTVSGDKQSLTLRGSLADVSLGAAGMQFNNVENLITSGIKLPMKDILFGEDSPVKETFDNQVQQLKDALPAGTSQAVKDSLEENLFKLVDLAYYVDESRISNDSDRVYLKYGLSGDVQTNSGEAYRVNVIRELYDGFWKVHAKLFTEYPNDEAMRKSILTSMLNWLAGKLGRNSIGPADSLASLLAREQRPTIASLYGTTLHGTLPDAGSTTPNAVTKPASGRVALPGMVSSLGLGLPNNLPVSIKIESRWIQAAG